ncbi:hypothetical protein L1987_33315 [Smallanthus sonchifolius]|uniref:Uncharacterized protein n=1 Tax=Smallanthus sonchifolius TaxID=185202 RepID=A0ACB9HRW0_9ASTR|nr:hypothetical protein L1987_33315 [Smallanthus sonchifolius]
MLKQILTSLAALSTPITSSKPLKGKMPMVEEEARKDVFLTDVADPQSIIPGTNMPLSLANALAQRIHDEENEAMRRAEAERKLEVYQSKATAKSSFKRKLTRKKLPNSDLRKIVSLGIDRFNDSERVRLMIQALTKKGFNVYEEKEKEEEPLEVIPIVSCELLGKIGQFLITYQNGVQEYLSADRIVTLVPDDLKALLKIPLKNDSNDKYFGNENDPDSSDVGESSADNEVPLAQSQTLISEWYYDQELKKFVIKRLDFTFSIFSELVDLSVLSLAELKLLSLMPMSSTTEEDGNYELRRETRAMENFNSNEIVCLDVRLLLNLAELPMGNKEMDEKASNIEKTIKEFTRAYKEAKK